MPRLKIEKKPSSVHVLLTTAIFALAVVLTVICSTNVPPRRR
jgi:hypothetical protein